MTQETTNITCVFDHADWLLCHKPIGVNFHSQDGEAGFIEQAKSQFAMELWPVHRLDKATSGLILLAKSQESCRALTALFAQRNIEKFYIAVCENSLKKKQGKVSGDMAKSRGGSYKLLKSKDNPAITQFISTSLMPGYRLCLLKPKTGKTHQLRVALKSLAAPIIGDKRYSGKVADRLYLHAFALKFEYGSEVFEFRELPNSGEMFSTETFNAALSGWSTPWDLDWP